MTDCETLYICWARLSYDHYYMTLCPLEMVLKASHHLLDKKTYIISSFLTQLANFFIGLRVLCRRVFY